MIDRSMDSQNLYGVLKDFHLQVNKGWELGEHIKVDAAPQIIIMGMGGSALPGEILKAYLYEAKIPIEVRKGYELPGYATSKSLVFCISYSGNTEEAIEAFREANRKGCQMVVISSGGKLESMAKEMRKPYIKVPSGLQPRFGIGYMFFAILRVLQNSGMVKNQETELKKTIASLHKDTYAKQAEELSGKLQGKIPLIYSSDRMYAVAYKWKIDFNENAKMHAFANFFPELNHNEMVGYTHLNGDYYVLMLKDEQDHPRIRKRMDITKKIIQDKGTPVLDIELSGTSSLVKIFSLIHLGDWTAYFLALRNGIDPSPVEVIESLKKQLV